MADPQHDSFLRRWSTRKNDARQGRPTQPEPAPNAALVATPNPPAHAVTGQDEPVTPPAPMPSLDDVGQLTPESDFSAFVQREVPADVKNAAMKKLFVDPHFNVMDGLDVYIDDYSQPDPLAPAMLRQMASAQFLKLVEEPSQDNPSASGPPASAVVSPQSVAQYDTQRPPAQAPHHDHADLRLQPDSNTGPQDAGADPV